MTIKATIAHNDQDRDDRVNLELREEDGQFVWYAAAADEEEYATDVTGDTEDEAVEAAGVAWGAGCWELEFADNE